MIQPRKDRPKNLKCTQNGFMLFNMMNVTTRIAVGERDGGPEPNSLSAFPIYTPAPPQHSVSW